MNTRFVEFLTNDGPKSVNPAFITTFYEYGGAVTIRIHNVHDCIITHESYETVKQKLSGINE